MLDYACLVICKHKDIAAIMLDYVYLVVYKHKDIADLWSRQQNFDPKSA